MIFSRRGLAQELGWLYRTTRRFTSFRHAGENDMVPVPPDESMRLTVALKPGNTGQCKSVRQQECSS